MAIHGRGQLTLTDLNDAIISGSTPSNPANGTLWIDSSVSPKLVKQWNATTSAWDVVGEIMDEGTGETISDITETLGNMANDNILDFSERQVIKDKLTDIIGYVISDATTTLPTTATLDAGLKGSFYMYRKRALNAGISSADAKYTAVATKYNDLKTYLEGLIPIDAWDISTANQAQNITVVKATFRDKWLQYYLAIEDLAEATTAKLKQNVDDVAVGGTNYASNGDFTIALNSALWSASYTAQSVKEIVDISTEKPPFQYALHVKNTSNSNAGIFSPTIWTGASAEAMVNKDITITFWAKYSGIVQGANSWNLGRFGELVVEGTASDGTTKQYRYPRASNINADSTNQTSSETYYFTGTDTTWKKYVVTHKLSLPSGTIKLSKISLKHGLEGCVGEFWTTGLKVEIGNKATDWSQSPFDVHDRLTKTEFKVTPDQIYMGVQSSELYNATIPVDAGDWGFERGAELWYQDHTLTTKLTGVTVVKGATGASSNNVIQVAGQKYLFYGRKIPISPSKRYKISFRVRQTADPSVAGTAKVYAGVGAYDSNKNALTTATYGTHRYVAIAGQDISVAGGWQEFSGIITGEGEDGEYDKFITGTEYATPMCIVNYSGGTGTVQIDYLKIEDVTEIDALAVDVKNMKLILEDDGLTAEISKTTFYKNLYGGTDAEGNTVEGDLSKKADSSKLSNYQTTADFNKFKTDDFDGMVDGRLKEQIGNEESDLNKQYSTKTELKATADSIIGKFTATGGMNLLKNSVGFSDFIAKADADAGTKQNWFRQGTSSRIEKTQGGTLDTLGFGGGFNFTASTAGQNATIDQYVNVVPNEWYTLSFYISKTNNSSSANTDGAVDLFFWEHGTTNRIPVTYIDPTAVDKTDPTKLLVDQIEMRFPSNFVTTGYEVYSLKFKPTTNKIHFRVYGYGLSEFTITGLMLTIGDVPLQWSLATGETYNTNVRLDINGIRVSQLNIDKKEIGYTQITPDEFSGWYINDAGTAYERVFYLNGDETVTKKLKALNEITMGTLKIINVNAGGNTGWAFVPIVET